MIKYRRYKTTPERIKIHEIKLFNRYEAEGYTITPLNADHDHNSGCVIYLIEKDGKCVLHANDTGYLHESINADDPAKYTGGYFTWQRSLFAGFIELCVDGQII